MACAYIANEEELMRNFIAQKMTSQHRNIFQNSAEKTNFQASYSCRCADYNGIERY